ncbi:hypothetical protein KA001_02825 [Patescibacteria group bacterium]|nr:hypothetical protein [Patescibacteria group bacterium]
MHYYLLLILYFLLPTVFYFLTIQKSKKYNREISWCDNAIKLKKPEYVSIPLLLMGFISVYFIFSFIGFYYSSFSILVLCNFLFYLFWILTIYKIYGIFHLLAGFLYVISLVMLIFLFLEINVENFIPLFIFYSTAFINLIMGFHIVSTKKPKTIHEEIQAICLTLYHMVIVLLLV